MNAETPREASADRERRFSGVVVVADVAIENDAVIVSQRRDLEQTDQATLSSLLDAITACGFAVTHYERPDQLGANTAHHRADVVLTIYGGQKSRNRMALVPAICEAFGLRFIGPDVYGRIIAQDKEVSKRLALDCGLRTPTWRVFRHPSELTRLASLAYPAVVKPLLEGSSIGIGAENLVKSAAEAERVALAILRDLEQPAMVEAFIAGREVAFVAIEEGKTLHWAYTEVFVAGQPDYFTGRLFDAQEKQSRESGRSVRNIDDELSAGDLASIQALLRAYGRFGYCRVDGRHADGKFHFIELTPDAWIDPRGQFAMGFTEKGWSYSDVIRAVLASAN